MRAKTERYRAFCETGSIGAAELPCDAFRLPGNLNAKLPFDQILAARERVDQRIVPKEFAFEPLTLADIAQVALRFGRLNARLRRIYGVDVPTVTQGRLARELAVAVGGNGDLLVRKRLLRYGETTLPRSGSKARSTRGEELVERRVP